MSPNKFATTTASCKCLLQQEKMNDYENASNEEHGRFVCCRRCGVAVGNYAYSLQVSAEPHWELGRDREDPSKGGAAKGDIRAQAGWQSTHGFSTWAWLSNQREGNRERQSL